MKRRINLLVFVLIMLSCKPSGDTKNENNVPGSSNKQGPTVQSIASAFPSSKLDNLIEEISQDDLKEAINDGESKNWLRTRLDLNTGEITLQNKQSSDNTVKFKLYGRTPSHALIAVQQANAQVVVTEMWEYAYTTNEDHPEQWNQYLLPEYKLSSFFDDRVILPPEFVNQSAKPYLDYELGPTSITVSLNKWAYMREMEADSLAAEGPMDPMLLKYKHVFKWNGSDLVEEKVEEPGYNNMLTFNSHVYEPIDGGPGPHEFDCGHGVSVKASSTLNSQGVYSYTASNLVDNKDATAWSEGVNGSGVGEWLEFTITSNYRIGDSWQVGNGYNRSKDTWQSNNRVKKLKVLVDEKFVGYVILSNIPTYQSFNIAPSWLKDSPSFQKGTKIKFVIEEVYKGTKYDDTLISYFMPTGNCG